MQIGDQCSSIGAGKGFARQLEGGVGRRVAAWYEGFGRPAKAAEKDRFFVAGPAFRDGTQGFDGIVGGGAGRQVQGKAVGRIRFWRLISGWRERNTSGMACTWQVLGRFESGAAWVGRNENQREAEADGTSAAKVNASDRNSSAGSPPCSTRSWRAAAIMAGEPQT